ncbi:MAG: ATP-binding cassette domain-containing protein [Jatrophihabitans sp.]|uniref:ATP-binding cassette domain-containing protein n=1 Tax=Jatrophihabitans sp. TaxID=1932789 RepID=UPI003F80ABB2
MGELRLIGLTAVGVSGVDLAVGAGSVTAVVGDPAAGKTALLRAVAGLEPARAGRVLVAGRDVTEAPPAGRGVALVFGGAAPSRATAAELIGEVAGGRAAVRQAAGAVGLDDPDRRLRELSDLDRRLAHLARAVAAGPTVLLLDEPTAGLDAADAAVLRARVRSLHTTTLWATRDLPGGALAGDELAVLASGRIVGVDRTETLRANPPTLAAARAFEPGLVVVRVDPAATFLPLPSAARPHRLVDVAIRTAHLDATGVEGRAITSDGDLLYVSVPGLGEPVTAVVTDPVRYVGFAVRVRVDASEVSAFDAGTGVRID